MELGGSPSPEEVQKAPGAAAWALSESPAHSLQLPIILHYCATHLLSRSPEGGRMPPLSLIHTPFWQLLPAFLP